MVRELVGITYEQVDAIYVAPEVDGLGYNLDVGLVAAVLEEGRLTTADVPLHRDVKRPAAICAGATADDVE